MIQSSQPSSLKFTWRAFLLHLYLDFLPCLFPCRLLGAVLLRRRGFSPFPSFVGFSSADLRDLIFSFISLNRFSLFLERSWMWTGPADCGPPKAFLNILSSAPTSSSFSERVETSNRYFCLLKGECKRLSARRKEENNCSQIHLECTVFREKREEGAHNLPQRPSLSLSCFQLSTMSPPQTNCS
uniref:Uncharacterized protein n=1 Tax=Fundulus heteroclitus TaxID=8078 RepID=A0A3Q2U8F4_FUNHE